MATTINISAYPLTEIRTHRG
ncbi:hypothetical protein CY0110_19572 [Crocosphaera chwakensis CCY0110]|uniref:Uncharacterized protein n=1 Tax=Crocosphaera chwakensis CCY0110 TaxID=391612 RepID=A3IJP6_9CHRO|nr:hypothetical protein CY0110_19572 [Crocosphaera chwakensis CCY0110]